MEFDPNVSRLPMLKSSHKILDPYLYQVEEQNTYLKTTAFIILICIWVANDNRPSVPKNNSNGNSFLGKRLLTLSSSLKDNSVFYTDLFGWLFNKNPEPFNSLMCINSGLKAVDVSVMRRTVD